MAELSSKILNALTLSPAIQEYRRKVSNRKVHVFIGDLDRLKASIYQGMKAQRAKGWTPTVKQDATITTAITEYLSKVRNILSSPSTSDTFSHEFIGGTQTSFKCIIRGEGSVEGYIQRLRSTAGLNKLSNIVKNTFGQKDKKVAIDLGHMEGSTIASQVATAMLEKFESVGGVPVNSSIYETLKVMVKYDPLGAKLAHIHVEDQFGKTNQSTTDEAEVVRLLKGALGDFVFRELPELVKPKLNNEINKVLVAMRKAGAKTSPLLPVEKSSTTNSTKTIQINQKVGAPIVDTLGKLNVSAPSIDSLANWSSIVRLINSKLTETIIGNMVVPALQNRTGRFANSAKVVGVDFTKEGFPSFEFEYQRDPYDVFDRALGRAPWNTPGRDPKTLIDKSIREIVRELAIGRFYTRRV